jgi:hypothetical protein
METGRPSTGPQRSTKGQASDYVAQPKICADKAAKQRAYRARRKARETEAAAKQLAVLQEIDRRTALVLQAHHVDGVQASPPETSEDAELERVFSAEPRPCYEPTRRGGLISEAEYRDRVRGVEHVISLSPWA